MCSATCRWRSRILVQTFVKLSVIQLAMSYCVTRPTMWMYKATFDFILTAQLNWKQWNKCVFLQQNITEDIARWLKRKSEPPCIRKAGIILSPSQEAGHQSCTGAWSISSLQAGSSGCRGQILKLNVALLKVHAKDMELRLVQLKAHKEASTCEVSWKS